MDSTTRRPSIAAAARRYWSEVASRKGPFAATGDLVNAIWEFLRDSTPSRRRQRYGDADYDWSYRVNTTSGAVAWKDRLLGAFHSPYQPTEPGLFHEMMAVLRRITNLNFAEFTFVDLGSGKGRALLMASDYPFRRIVGVELLPALHRIAEENVQQYKSESQKSFAIESICADATTWPLPEDSLVVYLFNPFPESVLREWVTRLRISTRAWPKGIYVLYHNPEHEHLINEAEGLHKIAGTHQYSIYRVG